MGLFQQPASPHYSWCLNLTGESSKVHYGPFKGM
jgi:hypothetical protein